MTKNYLLTIEEFRRRYPKLRCVERASDPDEYNRQRYLVQIAFNRIFLSLIPTFLVAAICAVIAYMHPIEPQAAQGRFYYGRFYLVRNVTLAVWGAWAIYPLITGWITNYCLVPGVRDSYVGTKYDSNTWLLTPQIRIVIAIALIISAWIDLLSWPNLSNMTSSVSVTTGDGIYVASIKVFLFSSICCLGTALFVTGLMAYLRYLIKFEWRKHHG